LGYEKILAVMEKMKLEFSLEDYHQVLVLFKKENGKITRKNFEKLLQIPTPEEVKFWRYNRVILYDEWACKL